jgi:hypothetical protein
VLHLDQNDSDVHERKGNRAEDLQKHAFD